MKKFNINEAMALESAEPGKHITTVNRERVEVLRWDSGRDTPYKIIVTINQGKEHPDVIHYCTIDGTCCRCDDESINRCEPHVPLMLKEEKDFIKQAYEHHAGKKNNRSAQKSKR